MIELMALLFWRFLKPRGWWRNADGTGRGVLGRMEGHADMDMSARGRLALAERSAPAGVPAISTTRDGLGRGCGWTVFALLIAGAIAARVQNR